VTEPDYRVDLSPAAVRQLDRLRGMDRWAVVGAVTALRGQPRPPGSIKLAGHRDAWRIRIRIDGRPWRIVYRISDERRLIVVAHIARRDEGTYRGWR